MTTIAVTGHMDLTEDSVRLVRDALDELLMQYADGDLVGVSCVARGSDSLFAEAVPAVGGRLVVVPSQDYRRNKVKPDHAPLFDHLVEADDEVLVLDHETANRQAYEAANAVLLERADCLVAVWNGEPPTGEGAAPPTSSPTLSRMLSPLNDPTRLGADLGPPCAPSMNTFTRSAESEQLLVRTPLRLPPPGDDRTADTPTGRRNSAAFECDRNTLCGRRSSPDTRRPRIPGDARPRHCIDLE
ncbi:hypothetical protein Save01_03260 [Streptomyces avermitilis]|uniref:Uncharacterized protein n=1 Tax=Streptomyces avermitilis TaxID=33903 RepID=A0A4D4MB29_STRAX|nr:hypothetical protein SAV14893_082220 [Streptomyces avermitilis]